MSRIITYRFCPVCAEPLVPRPVSSHEKIRPACPKGHFVHWDDPQLGTIGFVRDADRFLLLRRAKPPNQGKWNTPGGFVQAGEHPALTMVREIREETGLDVIVNELLGLYTTIHGGRHTVDCAFICDVEGGSLALSEESSAHRWVHLGEFPKLSAASERSALRDLWEQVERKPLRAVGEQRRVAR